MDVELFYFENDEAIANWNSRRQSSVLNLIINSVIDNEICRYKKGLLATLANL